MRNLLFMNFFTFVYKYNLQRIALPVNKKTKPAAFLNGIPIIIGTVPIENKEEKRTVMLIFLRQHYNFSKFRSKFFLSKKQLTTTTYYQLGSLGIHVKPMILLAVTDWID